MKKSSATLFSLFLLSTFTSYLPSATAKLLFDIDGKPLLNGDTYEIIPTANESGGGIELAATKNETCPHTVVLSNSSFPRALPVKISSPFRTTFLSNDSSLTFQFTDVPPCAPTPSYWYVVEGLPEGPTVKIQNTFNADFRIKRARGGYKLVYKEKGLGVHIDDDGIRRLVVAQNTTTLRVLFRKAFPSSGQEPLNYI